jgi:hypothetical protein
LEGFRNKFDFITIIDMGKKSNKPPKSISVKLTEQSTQNPGENNKKAKNADKKIKKDLKETPKNRRMENR